MTTLTLRENQCKKQDTYLLKSDCDNREEENFSWDHEYHEIVIYS